MPGALDRYATGVEACSDEDRSLAAIFAAHAAVALRTAREHEQLRQAIDTRDVIGQAKASSWLAAGSSVNASQTGRTPAVHDSPRWMSLAAARNRR